MSWQAYKAVAEHSRYRYRGSNPDPAKFAIMMAMAEHATATGQVGKPGDHRTCPSYQTLADHAGVHRNTAGKLIAQVVDDGELSIIASGGGGRGRWRVFQINLPLPAETDQTAETRPFADEVAQAVVQEIAQQIAQKGPIYVQLAEMIEELIAQRIAQETPDLVQFEERVGDLIAQRIAHLNARIAHLIAQKGGDLVQDPLDPLDPIDPKERGGADYPQICWDGMREILGRWREKRAIARPISDENEEQREDFIIPAMRIVDRAEGDPEKAWASILEAYQAFGTDYKPTRLAPIWRKIKQADEPAPPANGSGHHKDGRSQTETQKRTEAIIAEMAGKKK